MNRGGFTLIELLIALSIIGLIAILIHSSFGISINTWQNEEKKAESYQVIRLSLEQMKSKLRNFFLPPIKNPNLSLKGEPNRVTLITTSNTAIGGISKIHFWFEKDKNCLLMSEEELLKLGEGKTEDAVLLSQDVEELQIQYYDNQEKTWKKEWNSLEQGLPLAIKITLSLSKKVFKNLYIPPIVIPIHIGRHFEAKIYEKTEK